MTTNHVEKRRCKPQIILKKVKVHNLQSVDLTLEHDQLIVFTGVSGSGKSSLAFDTIYVEGQRRYIESLSTYARRHLGDLRKPDAESISGISPTIAIEQKSAGRNPRSTVGTMTGIYDFLRVLFARIGIAHCPTSGQRVTPQSTEQIVEQIQALPEGTPLILLAPFIRNKKGEFKEELNDLKRKGFLRLRIDGTLVELTEEITIDGKVAHDIDIVIDRIRLAKQEKERLLEGITMALEWGSGVMSVWILEEHRELLFSKHAYSSLSGLSYPPLEPSDFSFNHPQGMCPACEGLGLTQEFDLNQVIDPHLSIAEDCCSIASSYKTVRFGNIYDNLARLYSFDVHTPWNKLSKTAKDVFLYGITRKWTEMRFVHPVKKSQWTEYVQWKGVLHEAKERYLQATSDVYRNKMKPLLHESICSACQGEKIRPYPAATTVGGKRLSQITAFSVEEALLFFMHLTLSPEEREIADGLIQEIVQRLHFLTEVGLHYVALERTAPTLSGGESQRVRLAAQIGSGLVGATYVLDEPSIGLHPRDNAKLLQTLKRLRDKGNTVIVVEHDEETILSADTIVDVGPYAGRLGGKILAQGGIGTLLACEESLTAAYLSGKKHIPIPSRRKAQGVLTLKAVSHHNLKQITVEIPLKVFTAITGVSGSGKSSLIIDTLYPALSNHLHHSQLPVGKHKGIEGLNLVDKVIAIDQTPIGRTPRSNPATFIKLFDDIRDLFSQLPQAQAEGFSAGRFSFNVKEGSCPHCSGMGMRKIDMDFMEDEWVVCEHCDGRRFDVNTLNILFRGKNIFDVLQMTVREALDFFSFHPTLHAKLQILDQVGLDYLCLGQPSPTLSGGEAQRLKLAKELSRPARGNTLYILDEPTTGLHFHDIHKLIDVLQRLVSHGNTLIVIEHNMDLVKTADWVIDLGPEGGQGGGQIVARGTPEKVAKTDTPTGRALQPFLRKKRQEITTISSSSSTTPFLGVTIQGARQNNLKNVTASIPYGKITLCTGPSGSGKSSFAFETVYAEGQRRYVESLSLYARQFVKEMPKAKVDDVVGLLPAIAIEQKSHAGNPRSTVGTMTEAYDYLRVLYAHLGTAYCPETQEEIRTISKEYVVEQLLQLTEGAKVQILAPLSLKRHERFEDFKERWQQAGYLRLRLNEIYYELDGQIPFDPHKKNALFLVVDRLQLTRTNYQRLFQAVDQAASIASNTLVAALADQDLFFNLSFAVPSTGKSYPPLTPHTFSFNTAQGMCLFCQGLGIQYGLDIASHPLLKQLCLEELLLLFWKENDSKEISSFLHKMCKQEHIDPQIPLQELDPSLLQWICNGSEKSMEKNKWRLRWKGLNAVFALFAKSADATVRDTLLPFMQESQCPSCNGSRLNPLARNVKIQGQSIADLCALPIEEVNGFLHSLGLQSQVHLLEETLNQLRTRLKFLQEIGLGYLSLDRSAPSLSGGEAQRIRLARQLGSGLTGCLYVLDEPTIGLHPHDNEKLNEALQRLVALGNTLLLVEHDPLTLQLADYILDFGPKAGKEGGRISARGTLEEIKAHPDSLTGAYLSHRNTIPIPEKRKVGKHLLRLNNASLHNIHNMTVDFPLECMVCLTGVSGSGKSTLLNDILRPAIENQLRGLTSSTPLIEGIDKIDKLLVLDQNPIGHTIRADVSTYVDLFTPLRHFFALLPEAKARGLEPKHFSFNHKKGMCSQCFGLGTRTISMQFLPPVKVTCSACQGFRLNPLSLTILFQGKHLGDILHMTVEEALTFLPPVPKVIRLLETLVAVGLGYVQLGQEIATLSGGEAQRLRLCRELVKRATGRTLYLLDEPTVGLHTDDIAKLLLIFDQLVKKGNTIILIEHNLDLIAHADHLIDIGPGSGTNGGKIIVQGSPEEVAAHPTSLTAPYLKAHLQAIHRSRTA